MKLKINASSRSGRRYLLIEAENKNVIEESLLDYLGILSWSRAAPAFINPLKPINSNEFILAVNREEIIHVRAAFEISGKNIKVKRVSGTIKGLRK